MRYTFTPQYTNLAQPLFDRRLSIINGSALPTLEDIERGRLADAESESGSESDSDQNESALAQKNETTEVKDVKDRSKVPGIPGFWAKALAQSNAFRKVTSKRDTDALMYLEDVRLEWLPPEGQAGQIGFSFVFQFAANPFFENKVLTRTHYYQVGIFLSFSFPSHLSLSSS